MAVVAVGCLRTVRGGLGRGCMVMVANFTNLPVAHTAGRCEGLTVQGQCQHQQQYAGQVEVHRVTAVPYFYQTMGQRLSGIACMYK